MELTRDEWSTVCWQLVRLRHKHPSSDLCQWRLPWAQLLQDVGNLSCVCRAARDGCQEALLKAAARIRQNLPQQHADANRALQPVVQGRPFSLRAARRLLPFTAASRAKLLERLLAHLFLKRPSNVPLEILERRRLEGTRRLKADSFRFLRDLYRYNDPTAKKLLHFESQSELNGRAFTIIPELRLKFGTAEHGHRYLRRLKKTQPWLTPERRWCMQCGRLH